MSSFLFKEDIAKLSTRVHIFFIRFINDVLRLEMKEEIYFNCHSNTFSVEEQMLKNISKKTPVLSSLTHVRIYFVSNPDGSPCI